MGYFSIRDLEAVQLLDAVDNSFTWGVGFPFNVHDGGDLRVSEV